MAWYPGIGEFAESFREALERKEWWALFILIAILLIFLILILAIVKMLIFK